MTEKPLRNFNYYAMYFMSFFYMAAGVAFLTVLKIESLSESTRDIVGFVLIAYGIFRMYVLRKRYRR